MSVILERWQAGMLAGSVVVAGIAVAGGAFLGGYALGDQPTPPPPTELADKTYTVEDLDAALDACRIDGVEVQDGAVVLIGANHPATKRQCMVRQMNAPALAQTEYEYWGAVEVSGGEYSWSNVSMSWEQTDQGRDVTITVE